MLVIRDEQMEMFQAEADRKFVAQILENMKADLPADAIPPEKEPEMINAGLDALETAETEYHLGGGDSLAVFIRMAWLFGADFHLAPENHAILKNGEIHPQLKMPEVMKNYSA